MSHHPFLILLLLLPAPERLTSDGLPKQRPQWSPDGSLLTFTRLEAGGSQVWQYLYRPGGNAKPYRLTKRITPECDATFSPKPPAMLLVVIPQMGTQGNLDIASARSDVAPDSVDRPEPTTIQGDREGRLSHQEWPSFSPDGSRFAFSSTHEGNPEIYTCKADGSNTVRLTQSPGIDSHPCWSPDGKTIYFATDRWGGLEIARVDADGTNLTRITRSPGLDDYPALSPDGRTLAWVSQRDGNMEIYLSHPDGTNPRNLTNHPARDTHPTWTPDGHSVTFVSERDGNGDIYQQTINPKN